jgi:hypothetical protein
VFSSVMVFHANLLAVIKVERINFQVRGSHCHFNQILWP